MSGRVRCQRSRVVRLDVFSEVFEVVWSGWMFFEFDEVVYSVYISERKLEFLIGFRNLLF